MSSRFFVFSALLTLAGLAFPQRASADANWGSYRSLTVALTFSYTVGATVRKDETGKVIPLADGGGPASENEYVVTTIKGEERKDVRTHEYIVKPKVVKYGNAEILKQLVADGILPGIGENEPTVSGWSLVVIADVNGAGETYCARHNASKMLVGIDGLNFGLAGPSHAVNASVKELWTSVNTPDVNYETYKRTGSLTVKAVGSASIPLGAEGLTGIFTSGNAKTVVKKETMDDFVMETDVLVPGAQKLEKIIGTISYTDEAIQAMVEGSMSTPAATAVNKHVYANP